MPKLDDSSIHAALAGLTGWIYADAVLTRQWRFPTFPDGIAFVNRVAEVAEQANHHPDISINYSKITLALTTHDEGGVTAKDIELARRIDGIGAAGGA